MCYSLLQCVDVCYRVLQCFTMLYCSVLKCVTVQCVFITMPLSCYALLVLIVQKSAKRNAADQFTILACTFASVDNLHKIVQNLAQDCDFLQNLGQNEWIDRCCNLKTI